jgi:hypothetical protein
MTLDEPTGRAMYEKLVASMSAAEKIRKQETNKTL